MIQIIWDQATGMVQVRLLSSSKMESFVLMNFHPVAGGCWSSSVTLAFKPFFSPICLLTNQKPPDLVQMIYEVEIMCIVYARVISLPVQQAILLVWYFLWLSLFVDRTSFLFFSNDKLIPSHTTTLIIPSRSRACQLKCCTAEKLSYFLVEYSFYILILKW